MKVHIISLVLIGGVLTSSVAAVQRAPSTLVGRITDTRGTLLDGVRVSFRSLDGALVGPVDTAGGGLYALTCPRQDYGVLVVQADGFRSLEEPAFCSRHREDSLLDVTLSLADLPNAAGAAVTGVVRGGDGNPLRDVSVWITGIGTSQLRRDARTATDGSYRANFPTSGDFVICARQARLKPSCQAVRVDFGSERLALSVDLMLTE
jgi:hypothetical protein